ncbi:MAG: 23S rRNA (adenine(2503)-C(2))-methyltransferase RlmN [Flavobacteriaceae bacterium]|nr:23S rRNA (adenine(2503)-C(2))-methyltransferase RlmN [Flavobacteriaceae bacterium]
MKTIKKDIRTLSKESLRVFFVKNSDKAFRGNQVYEWLWIKSAQTFNEMTNLPLTTREMLKDNFVINHILVDKMQKSIDGTIKNAIKLYDGLIVESVLIPTKKRTTACVSSQVGCSLDCNFCATGKLKRMRNLNAGEIYDQVVEINRQSKLYYNRKLSNIVFMGMGEPLLNYKNVINAIHKITNDEGLGMSAKRITLSTVGIPKMIKKMADDGVKFNLAVSLHAAINEIRSRLMPINDTNNLEDLLDSLQYWYEKTKRKITFEYVVFKEFNDTQKDINALVKYCKQIPSKVNLITYNNIGDEEYQAADRKIIEQYVKTLETNNIIVKVRRSRGDDIAAACGQLANKMIR